MSDNLSKTMRRPRQYWFADGLPEMAIGCIFLVAGIIFLGQAAVPEHSPWKSLVSLLFPVLIVGGLWLTRWLVGTAKARLTYPRTGYVAYPRPSRRRRILSLLLGAIFAGLMTNLLMAARLDILNFTFPLQGLFVGVLIACIGQGLIRFYVVGGFTALLGIALAAAAMPEEPGQAVFYGLLGLALMASGGLTLWRYLRQNPLPLDENS